MKFDYLNLCFWSVAEIVVGVLILRACKPGFEVLVVCSIALIYAQIMWILAGDSFTYKELAASFAIELTAIRKSIEAIKHPDRDRQIYSSNDNPEVVSLQKETHAAQVRTWIVQAKYFEPSRQNYLNCEKTPVRNRYSRKRLSKISNLPLWLSQRN